MNARSILPFVFLLAACDGGGLPQGLHPTPEGTGPMVVWDLYSDTLPIIPLPNDVATWPDPTSPTGLRINASLVVPTEIESHTREQFDQLDGWGTFAPITVAFDEDLDLANLIARQGGPDAFHESDFPEHAVYLVDLETGLPVPLDVNSGNFQYGVTHTDQYFPNDPRSTESNLLYETMEEDLDGDGVLDPGEDTDYDGVLDHPNTIDGLLGADALDTYDRMAWFYERETKTLVLRPLLPLRQATRYAVVLTNRLVGEDGEPVRSPFDDVHHVAQTPQLTGLPALLAAHPELYGTLATEGWDGVAFAWEFTTQTVTRDLDTIREGLYGRGSMAYLASDFPPDTVPLPMQGGSGCSDAGSGVYVATGEQFREAMRQLATLAFDLSEDATEQLVQSYSTLDHIVVTMVESPHFFADAEHEDLEDSFEIDYQTGEARVSRDTLTMVMYVPTEDAEHQQPFDPIVYVHGHGSNHGEVLTYGGLVLQHGRALVTLNAQGHGLNADALTSAAIRAALGGSCIRGLADAFLLGRARDLDGDGSLDSGADYWTAYIFHTRDAVRQTVVDELQAFRVLRSFDGRRAVPRSLLVPSLPVARREEQVFDGDYDADGTIDLAGDFDADGTPDLGGPDVEYAMAGGSLGGIITGLTAGVEPLIGASTPVVGGGGLSDVAIRTENGSVLPAMILRVMGPIVVTEPSSGPSDDTSCAADDFSLRVYAPHLDGRAHTEFACLPAAGLATDDVLVVRNLSNGEVGCSGTIGNVAGRFRVHVASDEGDRWSVEYYAHGRDQMDFASCRFTGAAPAPTRTIETWEVASGSGDGACESCAQFGETVFTEGDLLTSPAAGFGRRRQTPAMRRLVMLAQIGLERGDPINYVGRVFLDPITAPDVPAHPRSMLVTHTDGDPNVMIATGYAMARAAGVLPFLPSDAPAHLRDYRAPASFAGRYEGLESPNDVLLAYHAIEGLPRLQRHPVAGGGESFLVDVDGLAEGRATFASDGRTQLAASEGGLAPVAVTPPLRWSRASRPMTSDADDVWTYVADEPFSGMVSPYVQPAGIHGFSDIYDSSVGFDMAVYMFNMLGRYLGTGGRDIPYLSDPGGHQCLEDSSCDYIRR